jgi:hypothetical protein
MDVVYFNKVRKGMNASQIKILSSMNEKMSEMLFDKSNP